MIVNTKTKQIYANVCITNEHGKPTLYPGSSVLSKEKYALYAEAVDSFLNREYSTDMTDEEVLKLVTEHRTSVLYNTADDAWNEASNVRNVLYANNIQAEVVLYMKPDNRVKYLYQGIHQESLRLPLVYIDDFSRVINLLDLSKIYDADEYNSMLDDWNPGYIRNIFSRAWQFYKGLTVDDEHML